MNPNWEINVRCVFKSVVPSKSSYAIMDGGRKSTYYYYAARDKIADRLCDHGEFEPDAMVIADEILADAYHAH